MANPDWVRDEVILPLHVYFTDKSAAGNKKHPVVIELSKLLNKLPLFPNEACDETFRNVNGVGMKLSNFLRLDPEYKGKGLSDDGNLEKEVWKEFYGQSERLKDTVKILNNFIIIKMLFK